MSERTERRDTSQLESLRTEVRKEIAELRTSTDVRHAENIRSLGRIDEHQRDTRKAIDDHAQSDLEALSNLHAELHENTKATKETATILSFGRGSVVAAKAFGEFVKWLAVVAGGCGLIYALWLWVTGRGPFPHP